MGAFDPVPWEEVEAVLGPPGSTVVEYVDRTGGRASDDPPSVAVKAVYDAWKGDLGDDRDFPDQGAAFLVAYLLERRGAIDPGDGSGFPSVVERRPPAERLRERFWEREHTTWWIAVEAGVHWALVNYWLWEDDIPLMERNLSDDSMAEIRARRGSTG